MIISDTHRNQVYLRRVFSNEENITHIFHLGDDYEDLDENPDLTEGKVLIRVPGIFHPGYLNKTIPIIQISNIEGWNCLLVHNRNDVLQKKTAVDIVCYGHTHIMNFEETHDTFYVNPGHLKRVRDKGQKPSYLILELEGTEALFSFKSLDGKILKKFKKLRRINDNRRN